MSTKSKINIKLDWILYALLPTNYIIGKYYPETPYLEYLHNTTAIVTGLFVLVSFVIAVFMWVMVGDLRKRFNDADITNPKIDWIPIGIISVLLLKTGWLDLLSIYAATACIMFLVMQLASTPTNTQGQ